MPDCREPEKIQAYIDGELPGSEAAQVAEHISRCPRCAATHRWLVLISSNLSVQARPQPAPELLETIHRAVDLAEPVGQILCSDAQILVSAHLDGELPPKEQLLMWRHLFTCEVCYQQFIQTQQITKALRHIQPVPLPAGLEAGVHNAVAAEMARREAGVISLLRWRISKRAIAGTLAAAAVLLIGLLVIPQQPVTETPELAQTPPKVSEPAEVPATSVKSPDVEKPAVARSITSPPTTIAKTKRASSIKEPAVRVASSSQPNATLTPAGTEAPQPVTPVQPPTDTASGPRLALYQPKATPVPPVAEEGAWRIKYTPIATAGESIYANLEPVAENRLSTAREGVNELVAMNASYSKRPELEIAH